MLAFTYLENPVTGRLLLLEELWQEVQPGLSSFADNPAAGAATIQTLIDEAKTIVPPHQRARTPVSLKVSLSHAIWYCYFNSFALTSLLAR